MRRDLTRTKLTTLQNLSFPDAIASLNLSGNSITRIAGVAFPNALAHLSLNSIGQITADDVEDTALVFEEFEVRQTDATLFANTQTFDVAATTKVTCSDSRAKRVYVRDTMLCVLSDEVFIAKYGDIDRSTDGGNSTAPIAALDEKWHQSRSWFLLLSAGLLSAFVASVLGVATCKAWKRRVPKPRRSRETTNDRNSRYSKMKQDEEDNNKWESLV